MSRDWKINEKEVGLASRLLLAVLYPTKSPPQESASSELITLLALWEESL